MKLAEKQMVKIIRKDIIGGDYVGGGWGREPSTVSVSTWAYAEGRELAEKLIEHYEKYDKENRIPRTISTEYSIEPFWVVFCPGATNFKETTKSKAED